MTAEGGAEQASRAGALTVATTGGDGQLVVAIAGELDLATVGTGAEAVATATRSDAESILLDVGGLTFIDSSGLAMLLSACRSAPGRVRLTRPAGAVLRVIELSGMEAVLTWAE